MYAKTDARKVNSIRKSLPQRSPPLLGGRNADSVKRDVNLKIARADKLGDDLHRIAGTSLDKGVEMDALIRTSLK